MDLAVQADVNRAEHANDAPQRDYDDDEYNSFSYIHKPKLGKKTAKKSGPSTVSETARSEI